MGSFRAREHFHRCVGLQAEVPRGEAEEHRVRGPRCCGGKDPRSSRTWRIPGGNGAIQDGAP